MIDIHTHLLPGVDDGSRTQEQTLAVLQRFAGAGVTCVVCTPHLAATEAAVIPMERYWRIHREIGEIVPPTLTVQRGWEIMLDRPGVDLTAASLRLGASNAILVEFPRGKLPSGTELELARLRQSGVNPVVAHPERYSGATLALIKTWRDSGAVIQTDTAYLLGGGARCELARTMLADGLIDILASDNHGDQRSLAAARDWLIEIGAADVAQLLTNVNPGALLSDQRLEPVPPVRLERGMFTRLREMLGLKRGGRPLPDAPIA